VGDADAEVFARWCAGDEGAGRVFVRAYLPAVARFFASKVGHAHEADDLTARTFEVLLRKRAEFRAEASPRTFLFAIAHHVLLGWVRDRQRAAARVDLGTVSAAALGPTPSSMLHAHRRERVLLEALRVLPLDAQIVLELTYFEEMSRADVAEVTGLPPGTVASRLRRARELLEVELVRRGAAPEPDPAELSASARALRASLSPDRGEPA
jgi:RNA polymerase sigma-70 factor (ECF subfamily)